MTLESRILLVFALLLLLLHIWGAIEPSHMNWGAHLLAFYGQFVALIALAGSIVLIVPRMQAKVTQIMQRVIGALSKIPAGLTTIILIGAAVGGAFLFPARMHLLGDGEVLLRSIYQSAAWNSDLVSSFRNQPLMTSIFRWVMNFHPGGTAADPYVDYFAIDILAAVCFVPLVVWFLRTLDRPSFEKVMLGCFLFFGAGSQFFFGYVENYVLQYVVTAAFVISGWFVLEGRVSVLLPVFLFALMAGLHLGNLIFFPSLLMIVYWKLRDDKLKAMLVSGAVVAAVVAGMFLMGFNLQDFLRHVTSGSVDFLPLFTAEGGNFSYPMFSVAHFWDWLNANFLIVPFGLAVAVVLIATHAKELDWKKPQFMFLILAAGCGLLFTWIINSALGLARDWDLLASFFIPLMILDVYLLSRPLNIRSRQNILAMIAGLTMIHCFAWIGVNTSPDRHLERMKLLNSPKFLSPTSQIVHSEALANYFFDIGDYKNARIYYEAYLKITDLNPRILANIADVYRRVGEKEKYFAALQRAVAMNSRDPGVFLNLGVEYANRRDTAKAIEYNEKAVAMDSMQQLAHANLGILYTTKGKYALADRHFAAAIELGMKEPQLFRYAGDVCSVLNEFSRAYQYYTSYLELVPSDKQVRAVRDRVRESLSNPPARQ